MLGRSAALDGSPNIFSLFIVRPHTDNFHCLDVVEDLVDQAVLYVDSSGIGT